VLLLIVWKWRNRRRLWSCL